jgi:AsmA protein
MRRLIVLGLVGLVLLGVVGVFIAPMLIPADVYRTEIAKAVSKATGREFKIAGAVHLNVFPNVRATVEKASLANAAGGQAANLAEIGRFSAGLKLMPLLARRVEISSFVLEDAVIHLEVDAAGKPNWQFDTMKPASSAGGSNPAAGQVKQVKEISLGDVRFVNGSISFDNLKTGASYQLTKIAASVALPSLDAPFKLAGDAVYKGERVWLSAQVAKARALVEGGSTDVSADLKSELVSAGFNGAATLGDKLSFAGVAKLDSASVRELAKWLGTPIAGGTGFGPLAVSGTASFDGKHVAFEDAQLHFDTLDATGAVAADLSGAKPLITGKLASPKLDLRPYTGGSASDAAAPAPAAAKSAPVAWSTQPIDASALEAFDANFDLVVDALLVRDVKVGRSHVVATVKDGVLTADLKELGLYQGKGQGRVTVDGRASAATIASSLTLSGLDLASFMADAAKTNRFEGTGNFVIDVKGSGRSQADLMSSLAGTAKIMFQNGAIKGVDLARIAAVVQGLTGRTSAAPQTSGTPATDATAAGAPAAASSAGAPAVSAPATSDGLQAGDKTKFVALGGNFVIQQGVMTTSDFKMDNDLLALAGQGWIDLANQAIDFRVEPGRDQKNGGLKLAMRVSGPLSHPKIVPDASAIIQGEIEKRLGNSAAGQILQGIFGGGAASQSTGRSAPGGGQQQQQQGAAPDQSQPSANTPVNDLLKLLSGKTKDK